MLGRAPDPRGGWPWWAHVPCTNLAPRVTIWSVLSPNLNTGEIKFPMCLECVPSPGLFFFFWSCTFLPPGECSRGNMRCMPATWEKGTGKDKSVENRQVWLCFWRRLRRFLIIRAKCLLPFDFHSNFPNYSSPFCNCIFKVSLQQMSTPGQVGVVQGGRCKSRCQKVSTMRKMFEN